MILLAGQEQGRGGRNATSWHRGVCWGSGFLSCVQGHEETLRPRMLGCVPLSCIMYAARAFFWRWRCKS